MTKLDNIYFLKATKQQQTGALFNRAGTLISRGRVVIFNGAEIYEDDIKREFRAIVWDVGKWCDKKLDNIKQQGALCLIGPE